MQPVLKPTLGTEDPRNPAQMSPGLTSQRWATSLPVRQGDPRLASGTPDLCAMPFSVQNGANMEKPKAKSVPALPSPCSVTELWEAAEFTPGPPSYYKSVFGIIHSPLLLGIRNLALSPLPLGFSSAHSCLTTNHISQPPLQLDETGDSAAANGKVKGSMNEASGSHPLKRKLLVFYFLFPLCFD